MCFVACAGVAKSSRTVRAILGEPQMVVDHEVLLVPTLEGGTVGWCLTVVVRASGCAVPRTLRGSVLVESCDGEEGKPPTLEVYAVTTNRVAAVSIEGGPRFPTRAESALSNRLRAVAIRIRSRQLVQGCPHLAAFNARGELIGQPAEPNNRSLQYILPGRRIWKAPVAPLDGVCQLEARGLRQITAVQGDVTTAVGSYRGIVGRGFLSCVDTRYFDKEEDMYLDAAVLLNAEKPGVLPPPPLPGMRRLTGYRGIFEARGAEAELIGMRIRSAWLVVEGEENGRLEVPLALLKRLTARVALRLHNDVKPWKQQRTA